MVAPDIVPLITKSCTVVTLLTVKSLLTVTLSVSMSPSTVRSFLIIPLFEMYNSLPDISAELIMLPVEDRVPVKS